MLNHSSGIVRDIEELSDLGISLRYVTSNELVSISNNSRLNFEPGSKFSYSNVGFNLLAITIERITGKSYKDAIQELLLKPNNLLNTYHDDSSTLVNNRASGYLDMATFKVNAPYEDKSYVKGAGSVASSANDLFQWSRALFKGNVLSKEQKKLLERPKIEHYAYGWFVDDYEFSEAGETKKGTKIYHNGGSQGFESELSYLVEHDITIIGLTNVVPSSLYGLTERLAKQLLGKPISLPKSDNRIEILDMLNKKGVDYAKNHMDNLKEEGKYNELPSEWDLLLIGRAYMDIHDHGEAEKIFKLITRVFPNWEYGYLFLAVNQLQQRKYQQAYCGFLDTLKIVPDSSNAKSELNKLKSKVSDLTCT